MRDPALNDHPIVVQKQLLDGETQQRCDAAFHRFANRCQPWFASGQRPAIRNRATFMSGHLAAPNQNLP